MGCNNFLNLFSNISNFENPEGGKSVCFDSDFEFRFNFFQKLVGNGSWKVSLSFTRFVTGGRSRVDVVQLHCCLKWNFDLCFEPQLNS
jgi:hypothetical protein